jgi:hypothetical protein
MAVIKPKMPGPKRERLLNPQLKLLLTELKEKKRLLILMTNSTTWTTISLMMEI